MPRALDVFGAVYPGSAPRRLRAHSGFGSADGAAAVSDVAAMLGAAEDTLLAARTSLVRLGLRQLAAGAGPLSQDAVDNFHAQRRQLAGRLEAFVERLVEEAAALDSFIGSLPGGGLFGGSRAAGVRNELGSGAQWAQALYERIPPLPYELVPNPKVGFNPALSSMEASFSGGPPALAVTALAVAASILVSSWGVARIVASFNATAQASAAEATRLKQWADGQVSQISALKAAGLTPQQITDALAKTPAPPAPSDPLGLASVFKWGAIGAGVLGVLYFVGKMIGSRQAKAA